MAATLYTWEEGGEYFAALRVPLVVGALTITVQLPTNEVAGAGGDAALAAKSLAVQGVSPFVEALVPAPIRLGLLALGTASELATKAKDGDDQSALELELLKDSEEPSIKRALAALEL